MYLSSISLQIMSVYHLQALKNIGSVEKYILKISKLSNRTISNYIWKQVINRTRETHLCNTVVMKQTQ